jgi:tetratricopeptide (TPR) repeat protein
MKYIFVFLFFIFAGNAFSQNLSDQKFKLGFSFESSGMIKEAEKIYEELVKSEPENKQFFEAYTRIMKQQSKFSQLFPVVENHYKKNQSLEVTNLLAELNWRLGKSDAANELWYDALKKFKNNANTYTKIAQTQIELKLFDKSISTLIQGRKDFGDESAFSEPLIKLYIATGDYKNGYNEIIEILSSDLDLATAQGRIYALMTSEESSGFLNEHLKSLADSNPTNYIYQELFAWFLRTTNRLNDALEVYIRIDQLKNTKGYEILNFANLSSQDGQYDISLKAYEIIINLGKNNPYSSNALYGYTRTLENKLAKNGDNTKEADLKKIISGYEKIIKDYPKNNQAVDSRLRLAAIYSDYLNNQDEAINQLQMIIRDLSNINKTIEAYIQLGKIYLMKNEITDSKHYFNKVIENSRYAKTNDKDLAIYNLALIDYFLGNFDDAKRQFKVISLNSESDAANDALDKLSFLDENANFIEPLKNFATAEYKLFQKKNKEAFEIYIQAAESAKASSLGETALINAAEIKFNIREYSDCINMINRIFTEYPNTINYDKLLMETANSYYMESNFGEALKFYTEVLAKYPNSIYLDDARKKIREIRKDKI